MARTPLTKKQEEILKYIQQTVAERGYPPSMRETAQAVGLRSSSTIYSYYRALEDGGYIRKSPNSPRAVEIITSQDSMEAQEEVRIPLIGQPIQTPDAYGTVMSFPAALFQPDGKYFAMEVQGNMIVGSGIMDGGMIKGDLAIVRIQDTLTGSGQYVATLDGHYKIFPCIDGKTMPRNAEIHGKVVSFVRLRL